MPQYRVHYRVYAFASVLVDAKNRREAQAKADAILETPALCHQCADAIDLGDPGRIIDITRVRSS